MKKANFFDTNPKYIVFSFILGFAVSGIALGLFFLEKQDKAPSELHGFIFRKDGKKFLITDAERGDFYITPIQVDTTRK